MHVWLSTLFSSYKYNPNNIFTLISKPFHNNSISFKFPSPFSPSFYQTVHISLSSANNNIMGIRLPFMILQAKQILKSTSTQQSQQLHSGNQSNVPKGHIAVYVGELQKKRFVVPISYLNHPTFLDLLNRVEEEFGYNHPMGGLTIPCKEDAFINLTSQLSSL